MRFLKSVMVLLILMVVTQAAWANESLLSVLTKTAPSINTTVLQMAIEAMDCAVASGIPPSSRLAVIDYSRPSSEPRLWVFDLKSRTLLFDELVAHGRNTGDNLAHYFSNEPGSLASSLGLFRTAETYRGDNGYSLRMDGLERGFNDRARERDIVLHGASYVDPKFARNLGRLGRSWGCPAVRLGIARQVIDALKSGQFIFSYYPDQRWLTTSHFLNCKSTISHLNTVTAINGNYAAKDVQ
ncbi:MAG: murein L,D-transpeptidase catalytic domain family protein [Pseudomonadales bacterium]|nr:murein L,D-transpeptidase catalytic domain family protein [Pseudomonadales bacterium]